MAGMVFFTDNYADRSSDDGYQFEFFCRRCGNGYSSPFQHSVTGFGGRLLRLGGDEGRVEPAFYNGAPALVLYLGDNLEGIICVEFTDGLITHFYAMRNPEKLGGVKVTREIARNVTS